MAIETKIQKIVDLIQGSSMNPKQKNFSYDLIREIVTELKIIKGRRDKLEMSNIGLYDFNYDSLIKNLISVSVIFGFSKYQLQNLKNDHLNWILCNAKEIMPADKKKYDSIISQLELYVILNHRYPTDIYQLRDFVKENKDG